MNIFKWEFKKNIVSTLIWSLAVIVLLFLFLSLIPTFINDADTFLSFLRQIPESIKKGMGVNIETMFSTAGFAGYIFNYLNLMFGIFVLILTLRVINMEKSMRMNDFIYSKPLKRTSITLSKMAVSIIMGLIFIVTILISLSLYNANAASEYKITQDAITKLMTTSAMTGIFMFAIAFFISAFVKRIRNVNLTAISIGFGFYIINIVSNIIDSELMKKISPFSVFSSMKTVTDGFNKDWIIIYLIFFIISSAFCIFMFNKADLED